MKIYYDYQILCNQKYGGISRYYYDLIQTIQNNQMAQVAIDCVKSKNNYFEAYFGKKAVDGYSSYQHNIVQLVNRINTYIQIHKGVDIIQPTYYNSYLLKFKRKHQKIVITVYDMIHELLSESFDKNDETVRNKRAYLYQADHIIAISQSTKNDILMLYPEIPDNKISVIYIGSSFRKSAKETVKLPQKYILFVGTRTGYKNFNKFFLACKPILDKDQELHLVCVGGGKFTVEEKEMIGNLCNQVVQVNADDDVLSQAYSNAMCFVFPSLYEGFGIPTLEAFTCDCPVLLSNTSSMPEVGGDAALYFNPNDITDIGRQISKVLETENLRKNMVEKGRNQLELFNWNVIAGQVIDCYEKVMKEN